MIFGTPWEMAKGLFVDKFRRGYVKGMLSSSIGRLRKQAAKLNELDGHFVTLAVTAMIAAGCWLDDDEAGAIKTTVMLRQYTDALLDEVRGGVVPECLDDIPAEAGWERPHICDGPPCGTCGRDWKATQ